MWYRCSGKKYLKSAYQVVGLVLLIMGFLSFSVFLSGCVGTAEESAYRDQVDGIRDRYNTLAEKYESSTSSFIASAEAQPNVAAVQQVINEYLPIFQQYLSEFEQIKNEFHAIDPPSKFSSAHTLYLEGIDWEYELVSDTTRAMEMIAANPSDALRALTILEEADAQIDEAHAKLEEADEEVFAADTGFLLPYMLVVGVVSVAFGVASGEIGRRKGRSFALYFLWGFFLGLIGLLIAFLLTRRDTGVRPQPQPGFTGYPPTPGVGYPPGTEYPPGAQYSDAQGYPPPLEGYPPPLDQPPPPGQVHPMDQPPPLDQPPPPGQVPPLDQGPPSGEPPQGKPTVSQLSCPHCGAAVEPTKPFCPNCKRPMGGL